MKKLIMFAVATVMALNVAQAADDDKKPAKKGRGGIQAMIKLLDLTADQKKALSKFNKENKGEHSSFGDPLWSHPTRNSPPP